MNTGTEMAALQAAGPERQRPGGVQPPSRRSGGSSPAETGTGAPHDPGNGGEPQHPGEPGGARKRRPLALRILLWLLRKSIVPLLCLAALAGGLYAGYVVLGKGPEDDVWQWSTWKHMWDLIFAE